MNVLVTGADGFVGRHVVARLEREGHEVMAAIGPGGEPPGEWGTARPSPSASHVLDLDDRASVSTVVGAAGRRDAVLHLAGVSSVTESRRDPGRAWEVNAAGTARLCEALAGERNAGRFAGKVIVVSSAEVYGATGTHGRKETDTPSPCSPYAASKLGAEIAGLEVWRRTGLEVVVARPFPHTGPGQRNTFAIPAFLERLEAAKRAGAPTVKTGDLTVIRDYLDVRDVAAAYLALLGAGVPGEVYNISRGAGIALADVFRRLATLVGVEVEPVADRSLLRAGDIPSLVGDPSKLHALTGWSPSIPLAQTLSDMVHAQAN